MTNTIFHDKSMLFLVLIVAFFVGASATNAFMDDAFAGNHGNNGNNGCENANPNAKACESNPNTVTCQDCLDAYNEAYDACAGNFDCQVAAAAIVVECLSQFTPEERNMCEPPRPPGF